MLNDNLEGALPPGGIPSDVADDVTIKASEGEMIIPANVVRFIGLEKLQKMVSNAEAKLSEQDKEVRPTDEEGVPEFATGGLVTSDMQAAGFSGMKTYTDGSGRSLKIPVVDGKPIIPVPQGFSENNTSEAQVSSEQPQLGLESKEDNERAGQGITGIAGSVDQWSAQDFSNYGKQRGTIAEGFGQSIPAVFGGPIGKAMVNSRQAYLDREVPGRLESMINSGMNIDGTPLTAEQLTDLQNTRNKLMDSTQQKSVGAGIKSAAAQFWDNLTGRGAASVARDALTESFTPGQNLPSRTQRESNNNGGEVSQQDRDNAAAGNGSLY